MARQALLWTIAVLVPSFAVAAPRLLGGDSHGTSMTETDIVNTLAAVDMSHVHSVSPTAGDVSVQWLDAFRNFVWG